MTSLRKQTMEKVEVTEDEEIDMSKYSRSLYNEQDSSSKLSKSFGNHIQLLKNKSIKSNNNRLLITVENTSKRSSEVDQKVYLKRLIKKHRVQNLVQNFCNKVKHNISSRSPVQTNLEFEKQSGGTQGLTLSCFQSCCILFLSTFISTVLVLFYSLQLVFFQLQANTFVIGCEIIAILLFSGEIILNFVSKHYKKGIQLQYIKDIGLDYLHGTFVSDFTILSMILIDILSGRSSELVMRIFRMIILIKMKNNLKRLDDLQSILIQTTIKQQYFKIVLVFVTNFFFAHMLSICLNCMAYLSEQDSWLVVHNLKQSEWFIRYIWGVYWGTTMMLTVGFGDFAASNYKQALCLTLIEMISCIALSYNINCVGNVINNIRSSSCEKNQNLRTFSRMASNTPTSPELQNRINNYIEQSFQIRKQLGLQEQDKLLEFIPRMLKRQYLKDVTFKIFRQIPFIKGLTEKTLHIFSESVIRYVAYPEQIILRKGAEAELLILHRGQLGFALKRPSCKVNGKVVQKVSASETSSSKLVTLDFLKSTRLTHDVKSLSYSILYTIAKQSLINCLKQSRADFQLYCVMRDRTVYKLSDYELYKCEFCKKQYHTKFGCPFLHFIPFHEQVIRKYIHRLNKSTQQSISFKRIRDRFYNSISLYSFLQKTEYSYQPESVRQFFRKRRNNILNRGRQFQQQLKFLESFRDMDFKRKFQNIDQQYTNDFKHSNFGFNKHYETTAQFAQAISEQTVYKLLELKHIECDALYNWTYYFPEYNPTRICSRTLKE